MWVVVAVLPLLSLAEELLLPTNSSAGLLEEEVVVEEEPLRDEEHPLVTLLETSPHAMSLLIKPWNYHPDTMVPPTPSHHNPPPPIPNTSCRALFSLCRNATQRLTQFGHLQFVFSRFLPWCTMATT